MHSIPALIAALPLLATMVNAWTLPANLTTGVYLVRMENGEEVHTLMSPPDIAARSAVVKTARISGGATLPRDLAPADAAEMEKRSPALTKRGGTQMHCGCGWEVDHGNCDAAVANLKGQLGYGSQISANSAWYAISNNVVAFACNQGWDGDLVIGDRDIADMAQHITDSCGWYIAGTQSWTTYDWVWNLRTAMDQGYMRYSPGDDFCAASESSSADHC
jgi:hypothetical protein